MNNNNLFLQFLTAKEKARIQSGHADKFNEILKNYLNDNKNLIESQAKSSVEKFKTFKTEIESIRQRNLKATEKKDRNKNNAVITAETLEADEILVLVTALVRLTRLAMVVQQKQLSEENQRFYKQMLRYQISNGQFFYKLLIILFITLTLVCFFSLAILLSISTPFFLGLVIPCVVLWLVETGILANILWNALKNKYISERCAIFFSNMPWIVVPILAAAGYFLTPYAIIAAVGVLALVAFFIAVYYSYNFFRYHAFSPDQTFREFYREIKTTPFFQTYKTDKIKNVDINQNNNININNNENLKEPLLPEKADNDIKPKGLNQTQNQQQAAVAVNDNNKDNKNNKKLDPTAKQIVIELKEAFNSLKI